MSQEDHNFVKTFASVVAGLVVFSILLGALAGLLQQQLDTEVSEARVMAEDDRIQPIGAVHTGESRQQAEATEQGEPEEAAPEGAAGGTESEEAPEGTESGEASEVADSEEASEGADEAAMAGQQVYQQVCAVCHDAGVGGAPTLTQEAWADRIEQGKETLYQHSIEGFQGDSGFMPAKGGRADLSDQEVKNAVDHMLSQVEGG